MQPKKNPKADLNKNRNLYFVIGLTFVLGITWASVEYKSYDRQLNLDGVNMLEDDEEDIPITEQLKTGTIKLYTSYKKKFETSTYLIKISGIWEDITENGNYGLTYKFIEIS